MKFAFIAAERASFPIAFMCRHLDVSKSGFYAWRRRPEPTHARDDRRLAVLTREAYEIGRKAYGSPRVHEELKARGVRISRQRVIRLMQEQGLKGKTRQRWVKTTHSKARSPGGAQPSRPAVRGERPQPAMGRGHHLPAHQ